MLLLIPVQQSQHILKHCDKRYIKVQRAKHRKLVLLCIIAQDIVRVFQILHIIRGKECEYQNTDRTDDC